MRSTKVAPLCEDGSDGLFRVVLVGMDAEGTSPVQLAQ